MEGVPLAKLGGRDGKERSLDGVVQAWTDNLKIQPRIFS